jgi:catechol O-methyltransferase
LYTTDLKILESSGLIGPGTTIGEYACHILSSLPYSPPNVVADNVIKPGNPTYLAYVRASTAQKRAARAARTSVLALAPDLVHAEEDPNRSKRNMSNGYEGDEQPVGDDNDEGDWRLVYKSRIVESWDPYTAEKDGVEISEIVGREG